MRACVCKLILCSFLNRFLSAEIVDFLRKGTLISGPYPHTLSRFDHRHRSTVPKFFLIVHSNSTLMQCIPSQD